MEKWLAASAGVIGALAAVVLLLAGPMAKHDGLALIWTLFAGVALAGALALLIVT